MYAAIIHTMFSRPLQLISVEAPDNVVLVPVTQLMRDEAYNFFCVAAMPYCTVSYVINLFELTVAENKSLDVAETTEVSIAVAGC